MTKQFARPAIFSAMLGFALVPGALAAEYKWIGQITEDGAALTYAIPDSDGIKLDLHCDRKSRKLVVVYDHHPKDAKDGAKFDIRLSVRGRDPGLRVVIAATGKRLELDDLYSLEGETRMSPQLRRILSEGGTLLVTVDGKTEEIPLAQAAAAARQLFTNCP